MESGYLKSQLVGSLAERRQRLESGEDVVVGVNEYTQTEVSPLTVDESIVKVDPAVEAEAVAALEQWRSSRDQQMVDEALARLVDDARGTANLMDASLMCARAGVTTGEWAGALREVFGEFRAPTGVSGSVGSAARAGLAGVRADVAATATEIGHRLRMLVGKPGLDGHSNGAEQVAVAARDAGFEVVYQGIRLTPQEIVAAAVQEDVDCIGLSILSGSHLDAVPAILTGLRAQGLADVPVIVGGIIPAEDEAVLRASGVADVFTPKDYDLAVVMGRVLDVVRVSRGLPALSDCSQSSPATPKES